MARVRSTSRTRTGEASARFGGQPCGLQQQGRLDGVLPHVDEDKGHPFEVLTQVDGVDCVVLSDQMKSLDWKIRRAKKKAVVNADVMLHVKAKMKALLQIV